MIQKRFIENSSILRSHGQCENSWDIDALNRGRTIAQYEEKGLAKQVLLLQIWLKEVVYLRIHFKSTLDTWNKAAVADKNDVAFGRTSGMDRAWIQVLIMRLRLLQVSTIRWVV